MIELGKYNTLRVNRFTDFGAYLVDPSQQDLPDNSPEEVLLPSKYVNESMAVGDEIKVFVYNDSEDRPVAVIEQPFAEVGQFAFLQVVDVNKIGAFLDWGLPKNLLVPYREQTVRMLRGGVYPVYVYLDDNTKRVVASAKIDKFLNNVYPEYKIGEVVKCLVLSHTDIGYKVIVNNLHTGMIYDSDLHHPLSIESTVEARVKKVRNDGKIDLTLGGHTGDRVDELSVTILEMLRKSPHGRMPLGDKSRPEDIERLLGCSKKDFKKALGLLYKKRCVALGENETVLISTK